MKVTTRVLNRPPLKYGWADTEEGVVETARKLGIEYDHRMTYAKLKQLCFDRLIQLKNEATYRTDHWISEDDSLAILRAVERAGFQFVRVTADAAIVCNPDYVLRWLLSPPPEPSPDVARTAVERATAAPKKQPPTKRRRKRGHKTKSWDARYA